MRFYTFVLKSVLRRPIRSILTMTGMAVAVGAFVALVGISNGFQRSFLEIYQRRGVDLAVSKAQNVEQLTSVVNQGFGRKIAALPEVAAVASGILDMTPAGSMPIVFVQGWPSDSFMFQEVSITAGRALTAGDAAHRRLLAGKMLAQNLQKHAGDTIRVYDEEFTIVGIYETFNVYENSMLVMYLEDLQKSLGRHANEVTGFSVMLKPEYRGNKTAIEEVRQKINALDPSGKIRAADVGEYVKGNAPIQFINAMALMTSAVAVVVGIIGMLNTMVMSVFERTREIGILRAIGWRPWRVMRMILMESLLLSLAGGVVGTCGAVLLTRLLSKLPMVSGFVEGGISLMIVLCGFVIALVAGLLGAAYPAYRGACLLPTEALRHE